MIRVTAKPGVRLGSFEILAAIGSGGMGDVFSARDLELGRTVAIKMLRPEIARDAHLLQRFRREAKTLASLNHAHIAQIYGIAEGTAAEPGEEPPRGLVLELVEGDTLEDRLLKGSLDMQRALKISGQIADALEVAHAQGIVHRDLKPSNIKITSSGAVKVLDFGIALNAPQPGGASSTELETIAGTLIGTPGYMSPEQVRGQSVDKRTDVWAFGCVLYELLTGQSAFGGGTQVEMLAAVLHKEPDWSKLPSELPGDVTRLLKRCLRKEPSERLRDMGDIRVLIDDALAAPAARTEARQGRRRSIVPWLVAGVALLGFVAVAANSLRQPPLRVSRLQVAGSGNAEVNLGFNDRDLAITPDGSKLIYVGNDGSLFVRALDALTPVAVYSGARPFGLFTSPDGEWIGFRERPSTLKKVPVTGGPAVTLAAVDASMPAGATWAPDDSIILAAENPATGLERVSASGGQVEVLTRPDREQGEADHVWPEMLPDGRSVLFTITALAGGLEAAQIAVLDLETGKRRVLMRGASHAHYVPSGHLVYGQGGALQAVAFDLDTLQTHGRPVTVTPEVAISSNGGVNFVAAQDGTMAYLASGGAPRTLVWVDREGRETAIGLPPRPYFLPALSPDGTRIAVFANDQEGDIWLWDLNRATFARLTTAPGRDVVQVWTPDSRRLIFSSERLGGRNLFWQAADGASAAEQLHESSSTQTQYPMAVTPDGRQLIFTDETLETATDLIAVELDGIGRVTPLVQSRFDERNGALSPDGRWLAYEANDSGRFEIYVRPYPDVNRSVAVVSTAGGTKPIWTRGGQELIYVSPTGALMRVGVSSGSSWTSTQPSVVVKEGYFTNTIWWGRSYDVSADGEKFLLIKESGSGGSTSTTSFVVVQNWFEELKRLAPTD